MAFSPPDGVLTDDNWSAYEAGKRAEGYDGVFPAGGEKAPQALLCGGGPESIPAEALAVAHGRADRRLGRPDRRVDGPMVEEGENVPAMS
ncbi:MAG: hypothetical protein ACE5EX_02155 [Phycisphaerae bacterium]